MMTVRAYTATFWLFTALTVPGLCLLTYAVLLGVDAVAEIASAVPAVFTGLVAAISWYARREARAERGAAELAAANDRESDLDR